MLIMVTAAGLLAETCMLHFTTSKQSEWSGYLLDPELCPSWVEGKCGMFSGRTAVGFCVNHV